MSPARLAAFRILLRVLKEESYVTELLHSPLADSLDEKDLRLATELIFGVLRQQALLDAVLACHSKLLLGRLDPEVLLALRLAAYQVLFLDRVPARAALNESVELVKTARLRSAAGYVNAVLRKISKTDLDQVRQAFLADSEAGLSRWYSHPEWLVRRWLLHFGRERVTQLLEHNNQTPRVYFRVNSPELSSKMIERELCRQAVSFQATALSEDIFEATSGNLHQTTLFKERHIIVQDAGSQLIPRLLELQPTDVCLDLCAGLGGKSSLMAWLKKSATPVVATDLHWHRLQTARRLHANCWKSIAWVACDGAQPLPFSSRFDKILVDAPCSGTGTLQRHPEIRWRLSQEQIMKLGALQSSLLESAFRQLRPGGRLVYSTCSLEREENEAVVSDFLNAHPEALLALPEASQLRRLFDDRQFLSLFPPDTGTDGFFAAVLEKPLPGRP